MNNSWQWTLSRKKDFEHTRVKRFSYLATKVPENFSIASIADEEALDTVKWRFGVLKCWDPCINKRNH